MSALESFAFDSQMEVRNLAFSGFFREFLHIGTVMEAAKLYPRAGAEQQSVF
jgi:hypothetical protein